MLDLGRFEGLWVGKAPWGVIRKAIAAGATGMRIHYFHVQHKIVFDPGRLLIA